MECVQLCFHSPLQRWIDISTRKTKKPPRCELCHYLFHRHKKFRVNITQKINKSITTIFSSQRQMSGELLSYSWLLYCSRKSLTYFPETLTLTTHSTWYHNFLPHDLELWLLNYYNLGNKFSIRRERYFIFVFLVTRHFTWCHNSGLVTLNFDSSTKFSPIHSTSLEMSEVSSETAILLISVPQQTDTAIFWSAL